MEAKKLYTGQQVSVKRTGRTYSELATVVTINVRDQRAFVMMANGRMVNVSCECISAVTKQRK